MNVYIHVYTHVCTHVCKHQGPSSRQGRWPVHMSTQASKQPVNSRIDNHLCAEYLLGRGRDLALLQRLLQLCLFSRSRLWCTGLYTSLSMCLWGMATYRSAHTSLDSFLPMSRHTNNVCVWCCRMIIKPYAMAEAHTCSSLLAACSAAFCSSLPTWEVLALWWVRLMMTNDNDNKYIK